MTLAYQVVTPGNYVRLSDAAYAQGWTSIAMTDNGLGGDVLGGDAVYTATLPGSVQTHRHLIRYRITVADTERLHGMIDAGETQRMRLHGGARGGHRDVARGHGDLAGRRPE